MTQKEIQNIAIFKQVSKSTIDKDWVLGHFLNAMYSIESVRKNFVFKGGTCLKKCYFENYRFSEDLDFTLLDKNYIIDTDFINLIINRTKENCNAKFQLDNIKTQIHKDIKQGYEVTVKFWGADHKPNQKPLLPNRWQTKIKLDISFSEQLLLTPVLKKIMHPYSDNDKIISIVPVYSYFEIVAEKLRALVQRNRPRDIYDNWYFSHNILPDDYRKIKTLLIQKAKNKTVDISKLEYFMNDTKRKSNKRAWESSLTHQIQAQQLPDFDNTYEELQVFIKKILRACP